MEKILRIPVRTSAYAKASEYQAIRDCPLYHAILEAFPKAKEIMVGGSTTGLKLPRDKYKKEYLIKGWFEVVDEGKAIKEVNDRIARAKADEKIRTKTVTLITREY